MAVCLLVRHGHSSANEAGELAGWREGVRLTDRGREQARAAAELVASAAPVRLVSSPLERCRETAKILGEGLGLTIDVDDEVGECHYGVWTGRPLRDLAADPLWRLVQDDPEEAVFPPSPQYRGESLVAMGDRLVTALRRLDAAVETDHGPNAVWVAVSHGDPIKALLAHAGGGGIAQLQRFHVDPGSVSIVRLWAERSMLLGSNLRSGPLADVVRSTTPPSEARAGDAVPGGGAG